jgi:hypothetical protein
MLVVFFEFIEKKTKKPEYSGVSHPAVRRPLWDLRERQDGKAGIRKSGYQDVSIRKARISVNLRFREPSTEFILSVAERAQGMLIGNKHV